MSNLDQRSTDELKEISKKVAQFREQNGLSQYKFAELCLISERHIQHIEKGTDNCSLKTLVHICVVMNLSIYQLLAADEHYTPSSFLSDINFEEKFALEKQLLGKRISTIVKRQGKKQGKVAADIEREDSEISQYIHGRVNLQYISMVRIADGLKIPTLELFNYEEQRADSIPDEPE